MIQPPLIRQAAYRDIPHVVALWTHASRWLGERGFDQWQYPVRTEGITAAVDAGTCWVVERANTIIATITLDTDADPLYWPTEDDPDDALYAHRMVVSSAASGMDLGGAMLDWAGRQAAAAGRSFLRLDAWRTNEELHAYYLRQGFRLVRLVDDDPRGSGACFERSATVQLGGGPTLIDTDTPCRESSKGVDHATWRSHSST